MVTTALNLNFTPGGAPLTINISQYDVGLRTYEFTPFSTPGTLDMTNAAAVTLEATKPDGNAVVNNCTYNSGTGKISYTVGEQLAAAVGRVWSKVVVRDTSDNVLGTAAIVWIVEQAGVTDEAVMSDSDISAVQEFVAEFGSINAYKAALDGCLAAAGGTRVAATKAAMTDQSVVYVYTGSESGMVTNNWYWYNGSDWVSGGAYQASVATDATLTTANKAADAKATGDAVNELKTDLNDRIDGYLVITDTTKFHAQKGAISSTTANTTTNTLTIASSNNRMVIGPFKMERSFKMIPSANIKYKLYKRISTSTYNVFTDIYSTWQTTTHIEGVSSQIYDKTNYYLQLAYSNDANISDITALSKEIKLIYDNDNIYELYEGVSTDLYGYSTGTKGNATGQRLISKKFDKCTYTVAYVSNTNYRLNALSGQKLYDTAGTASGFEYGANSAVDAEVIFVVQNYTGQADTNIQLKNYTSFKELYTTIGLNVEQYNDDYDFVTGFQDTDPDRIINANTVGNTIRNDILASMACLNDSGAIKYSHCPSITTDGTKLYVVFMCDRSVAQESATTTEIELAVVNASTMAVERYVTIAKSGTYGGETFNGRCSYPASYIDNGTLYILFSGTISGVQTLCVATYNTSANTYTISACNFTINSSSYTFNSANFLKYVGGLYGITDYGYEIGVCNPVLYGGNYYVTVSTGNKKMVKTVILQSSDLTNWTVYDVLDGGCLSSCEAVCGVKGDYMYIAMRHDYVKCTMRLVRYKISTKVVEQWAQLSSVSSRPTIFYYNSNLYLVVPRTNRRTMEIYVLQDYVRDSRLAAALYDYSTFAYNSITNISGTYYYAIHTKRTGVNTVGDYPVILLGKSSQVIT